MTGSQKWAAVVENTTRRQKKGTNLIIWYRSESEQNKKSRLVKSEIFSRSILSN